MPTEGGTIRRRVLISGRVQGVFFRASCQREAALAGLTGWARNLNDGRVEAVFEGSPDAVERLVAWCRVGPRLADVTHVEVAVEPPQGLHAFGIR